MFFLEEDEREIVAFVPEKNEENSIQVEQAQDYRDDDGDGFEKENDERERESRVVFL